jgi:hypothetical protein
MRGRYAGGFGASIALHAALAAWLAWPPDVPPPSSADATATQVVLVAPNEDRNFPGLKPLDPRDTEWTPDPIANKEEFAIADLQRIGAHYQVLFPFVSPGLAIDALFPTLRTTPQLVFENPFEPGDGAEASRRGALRLSAAALQALVDKSWSRGNRWQAFVPIRELAREHDADDDGVARLVRLYREQNALQPYADGPIRDLRLWAQLGLAADHAAFIGFIRQYAARNPSSKVTTELLFLLDTIVQGNEDALAVLVETDQPGDLAWTRETNPRAYLLARHIQRHYARALVKLRLTTRAGIEAYHADVRLAILTGLLQTTPDGYRVNDARFLIGAIHWRQNRPNAALRVWSRLTPPADDTYATAISRIRAALDAPRPAARDIEFILRNEMGRWLAFSDDRLRRFGYRFDTF